MPKTKTKKPPSRQYKPVMQTEEAHRILRELQAKKGIAITQGVAWMHSEIQRLQSELEYTKTLLINLTKS